MADLGFARNSGMMLGVGVLGGAGVPDDLAEDADVLIPDLDKTVKIVAKLAMSSADR